MSLVKGSGDRPRITYSLASRKTRNVRFAGKRNLRERHAKETQNTEDTDYTERTSLGTSLQLTAIFPMKRMSLVFSIDYQWSFKNWPRNGFEGINAFVSVPEKTMASLRRLLPEQHLVCSLHG